MFQNDLDMDRLQDEIVSCFGDVGGLKVVRASDLCKLNAIFFLDDYLYFKKYCIKFLMSFLIVGKYGQTQRHFCTFGM
jgi:hypothetical protein